MCSDTADVWSGQTCRTPIASPNSLYSRLPAFLVHICPSDITILSLERLIENTNTIPNLEYAVLRSVFHFSPLHFRSFCSHPNLIDQTGIPVIAGEIVKNLCVPEVCGHIIGEMAQLEGNNFLLLHSCWSALKTRRTFLEQELLDCLLRNGGRKTRFRR